MGREVTLLESPGYSAVERKKFRKLQTVYQDNDSTGCKSVIKMNMDGEQNLRQQNTHDYSSGPPGDKLIIINAVMDNLLQSDQ